MPPYPEPILKSPLEVYRYRNCPSLARDFALSDAVCISGNKIIIWNGQIICNTVNYHINKTFDMIIFYISKIWGSLTRWWAHFSLQKNFTITIKILVLQDVIFLLLSTGSVTTPKYKLYYNICNWWHIMRQYVTCVQDGLLETRFKCYMSNQDRVKVIIQFEDMLSGC